MTELVNKNEVAPQGEYQAKSFQMYHWAWLGNHPDKTPGWLGMAVNQENEEKGH